MTISETDSSNDPHIVRRRFSDAMSVKPLYDHLDKAYQDAGLEAPWSPFDLWWGLQRAQVPPAVHALLDAETIRDQTLGRILIASTALVSARSDLSHDVSRLIVRMEDRPSHVPQGVIMRRIEAPGFGPEWRYEFNPYWLARVSLNRLASFIQTVHQPDLFPFMQLIQICAMAKRIGPATGLVINELQLLEARSENDA